MADPRICTRTSSCLCDTCTPRRIRALSSSSTETQRQFLHRASSFSSLPFPPPPPQQPPPPEWAPASAAPQFEYGESSRARSPPPRSRSPTRSASYSGPASPSSPTRRRVSFDQAGAAATADPGPCYDDRPHRLYSAAVARAASPPPAARAASPPPPPPRAASPPPPPPPRAAPPPPPLPQPVNINNRTPEQEAAAFDLPPHVAEAVVGLRDGIAYVFRHIQGCSARRKETMREAVQKVIDYFDANISYEDGTPTQELFVNNYEKGMTTENEPQIECTICQESMEGEFPMLLCTHRFHTDCLESYFKSGKTTCPNCRRDLGYVK